jgi:hypothetical protein
MLEPPRKPDPQYPILFHVAIECGDSNCISLVELLSIRDGGTTESQWKQEMESWILDGLHCANDHALVVPDPDKVKYISYPLPTTSGKPL